jgi:hypothetical protein
MVGRSSIVTLPMVGADGRLELETQKRVGRKLRKPSHPFYLSFRPYQITPFCLAPVLPGESMTNALIQARIVTDPIKNPLIGWWAEYWLFYVKLSDLKDDFAELTDMLLKNTEPTNWSASSSGWMKDPAAGYNYLRACVSRVTQTYFRDEEECPPTGAYSGTNAGPFLDNYPQAKCLMNNALQSLTGDADVPRTEVEELPGEGYDALPSHLSGFADQFAQWKEMVAMRMTEATFDDWVKQFGVRVPREEQEELHIPELIRYLRDFQYPSNTVNPATGGVKSAVSWSVAERADKDRFFKEPGFILGVCTARPKVYLKNHTRTVTQYMNDAYSWLPAVLQPDPYTSLKKFTAGNGPVPAMTDAYWIDLRDLFMHGEQFTNLIGGDINGVTVPVPATTEEKISDYASSADIDGLFSDAGTLGASVRCDGRIDFSIKTRLEDTTP